LHVFETIHGGLQKIARFAVWVGGAALLLAAIMVTGDVLSRKFLGITMSGSDEISGYIFAGGTTWAYSYCAIHRSNIRIDALYNLLPKVARAILDVVGLTLLFAYMALLTVHGWDVFATSWAQNSVAISTLATPLWIPQIFWITGLFMFLITLSFLILYSGLALVTGQLGTVQGVAGTLSVQEEIEEETHGIEDLKHKNTEGRN
jgi:TRAP-type C4-dicarboxylate transport system permease small subunit|tara:strand:- start:18 stop:629 length:612 start_codon:yes stop_codon:yes gene_type:complete